MKLQSDSTLSATGCMLPSIPDPACSPEFDVSRLERYHYISRLTAFKRKHDSTVAAFPVESTSRPNIVPIVTNSDFETTRMKTGTLTNT
jgi:hypothetical protein